MNLYEKHQESIAKAIEAIHARQYYAAYPEHPKAYPAEWSEEGLRRFNDQKGKPFTELLQPDELSYGGGEQSPYTNEQLQITYPLFKADDVVARSKNAWQGWKTTSVETRAGILAESLEAVSKRFFEIGYATMHTTGQSFMMSFQASGPHAADRAMEAIAMGVKELKRFPQKQEWSKPMGKFNLQLQKTYRPVPKGVGLVIGCSTFPTWNTVPGVYANLIAGNTVIVKPHPGAVWPIAIFIAELQHVLQTAGFDPHIVQLAADTNDQLITKELAEHTDVQLIDYTGGNSFGDYIESLPKTVFTEKAGINSVILDSADNLRDVLRNQAFAVSLYSGQMCTAPQNYFIPKDGVKDGEDMASYEDVIGLLRNEVSSFALHPKMGAGTLGAIQNENTLQRASNINKIGANVVLEAPKVTNPEFENARICAPSIIEVSAEQTDIFNQELFGPMIIIVKTENTDQSIALAAEMGKAKGAITCSLYTTDKEVEDQAIEAMNEAFVPVSVNFTGFAFVNQHAAFSDFHVTGGNPAGNASFTDPSYINRRFVWVGNRKMA